MLIHYMLNKKSDLNSINILSNLNKFTYTKQNKKALQKQPNVFEINKKDDIINNVIDEKRNNYYRPKQINSLFWCVFIAAHGYNEYLKVNHNYGVKVVYPVVFFGVLVEYPLADVLGVLPVYPELVLGSSFP